MCAGEPLIAARDGVLATAGADRLADRIAGKDATTWGPAATSEATIRLGWLDCAEVSRPLVSEIETLRVPAIPEWQ